MVSQTSTTAWCACVSMCAKSKTRRPQSTRWSWPSIMPWKVATESQEHSGKNVHRYDIVIYCVFMIVLIILYFICMQLLWSSKLTISCKLNVQLMKGCSDLSYIRGLNRSQSIRDTCGPDPTVRHACDSQINLHVQVILNHKKKNRKRTLFVTHTLFSRTAKARTSIDAFQTVHVDSSFTPCV